MTAHRRAPCRGAAGRGAEARRAARVGGRAEHLRRGALRRVRWSHGVRGEQLEAQMGRGQRGAGLPTPDRPPVLEIVSRAHRRPERHSRAARPCRRLRWRRAPTDVLVRCGPGPLTLTRTLSPTLAEPNPLSPTLALRTDSLQLTPVG